MTKLDEFISKTENQSVQKRSDQRSDFDEERADNLLRRVKKIEIASNRVADEALSGQFKSVFRGQGIEFDEVREYSEGDDVRSIDWNVTARAGKPYVKRYSEERERTLIIVFDVSASNIFGSRVSRIDTAAEISASLMFSAIKSNDKVGLLTFADGALDFYPPRKGKKYVLRLTKAILQSKPRCERTDLNAALEFLDGVLKRRAIVFVISDFYVSSIGRALRYCRRRNDVVAVSLEEPLEKDFPNLGFVTLRDPESGATLELDSASKRVRETIIERIESKRSAVAAQLKDARVDCVRIVNGEDYALPLQRFFRLRERR